MERRLFLALKQIVAEKTFELRDFAAQYGRDALAAGRRREAASFASKVRQIDKRIAKFGMVRDAPRP